MKSETIMQSPPGRMAVLNGRAYLYFGGTGYLGLAGHPDVIQAGCEALKKFGVHSATSRAGYGTHPPLVEVESKAAEFFRTESSFYFGSGYMSNHIMVSALAERIDLILLEQSAHYCMHEAARLAQKEIVHFSKGQIEKVRAKVHGRSGVLLMADAVGPVTGDLAPVFRFLQLLSESPKSMLLLDDAHGFGVLGPQGRGLMDHLGLWGHVNGGPSFGGVATDLFVCGTLAKALGGFGGIIPGTGDFIRKLQTSSHYFDGASAPASAVAGSTAKALELAVSMPELRTRLRRNAAWLRSGLTGLGVDFAGRQNLDPEFTGLTAHLGLVMGDASDMQSLEAELKQNGILVPFIRQYSGTPPQGMLRIAVSALHTQADIDRVVSALSDWKRGRP